MRLEDDRLQSYVHVHISYRDLSVTLSQLVHQLLAYLLGRNLSLPTLGKYLL